MPYTPHPDYDTLPEAIRCEVTEEEYAWLPDESRARLIEEYCYPEKED